MKQILGMSAQMTATLSQQMQASMKILQLSSEELRLRIEQEYLENPMLEVEYSYAPSTSMQRIQNSHAFEEEKRGRDFRKAAAVSLTDNLLEQASFAFRESDERRIAKYLIGCIDHRGYLSCLPQEAAAALCRPLAQVERVLSVLQTFEPAGIGARNIEECLTIQAKTKNASPLTLAILQKHLESLGRGHLREIARSERVTVRDVEEAARLIRQLSPKPGASYGDDDITYVRPDVVVYQADGITRIEMAEGPLPTLRLVGDYQHLKEIDAADKRYLDQCAASAKNFLSAIERRKKTLLHITKTVLEASPRLVTDGRVALSPLSMEDAAARLAVNVSTISRAVKNKYVEFPWGIFPMRLFFSQGIASARAEKGVSAVAVETIIQKRIAGEDKAHPLSDQAIADSLNADGIAISRRTVVKYRERLGIPSSNKRKHFL